MRQGLITSAEELGVIFEEEIKEMNIPVRFLKEGDVVTFIDVNDSGALKEGVAIDVSKNLQEDKEGLLCIYLVRNKNELSIVLHVVSFSEVFAKTEEASEAMFEQIINHAKNKNAEFVAIRSQKFGKDAMPFDFAMKRLWKPIVGPKAIKKLCSI